MFHDQCSFSLNAMLLIVEFLTLLFYQINGFKRKSRCVIVNLGGINLLFSLINCEQLGKHR